MLFYSLRSSLLEVRYRIMLTVLVRIFAVDNRLTGVTASYKTESMALQSPPFGRSIYLLCTPIHFQTHLSYFILYHYSPLIRNNLIVFPYIEPIYF